MQSLVIALALLIGGCATTSAYDAEQAAFNDARSVDTAEAYEQFMTAHPATAFRDNAVYYRDRSLYNAALASKDIEQLNAFVSQHPKSDWRQQAEYYIQHGFPAK